MSDEKRPEEGALPERVPAHLGGSTLYRALRALSQEEQSKFVVEMFRDKESYFGKFIDALAKRGIQHAEEAKTLSEKLKHHRRPKMNAERDAEIMRLNGESKTAGQIVSALAARWKLTDKMVNAVISRERRRSQVG